MARFPKTLGEALNDQAASVRGSTTLVLSTPAMDPIDTPDIVPGAVGTDQLSTAFHADLTQRIDDAAASIVDSSRIAPGAVLESNIADFAITVKKLHSDRHHLY